MPNKTIVVFRRWKTEPHTLIALFPTVRADRWHTLCSSYEHRGQHGAAHYKGVLRRSYGVTEPEAKKDGLYWELDVRMMFSNHWRRKP